MLLVPGVVGIAAMLLSEQTVYAGVRLAGLDMGGRSRQQVEWLASGWQKDYQQRNLLLAHEGEKVAISAAELDLKLDTGRAAETVWLVGRHGSLWERLSEIYQAQVYGAEFWPELSYRQDKMDALLDYWSNRLDKPAKNAYLSVAAGGLVSDERGFRVNRESLRRQILQAFSRGDVQELEIPTEEVRPEVTQEELAKAGTLHLWGSFVTRFNPKDSNRSTNVALAAKAIDGVLLKPGGEFSFNKAVGPRVVERGFREAPEIVDGELVPGVGGGICQVSSTLYNAALLSGLAIQERTNHAKPLSYVQMGRDATVVYGELDFRFVNDSDSPLLVRSEVIGDRLYVGFFGKMPLQKEFELVSLDQERVDPNTVEKFDRTLAPGEVKIEKQGDSGWRIRTVRLVKEKGKPVMSEDLGRDFYWPDDKVVKFGPPLQPVEPEKNKADEERKASNQPAVAGRI